MAASSAVKSFVQHAEERCHSVSHVGPGGFLNLLYLVGTMGSFRGPTASCFPVSFSFWQNNQPYVDCHAWQGDWTARWWSGGVNTRKGLIWCLSVTGTESLSVSRPGVDVLTDGWEEGTKALGCCLTRVTVSTTRLLWGGPGQFLFLKDLHV